MKSEHRYGIVMILLFLVVILILTRSIVYIIGNFATGKWDMSSSIYGIIVLIATLILSTTLSKFLDAKFSREIIKSEIVEDLKLKIITCTGAYKYSENERESARYELNVLHKKSKIYLHDDVTKCLETILEAKEVTDNMYNELVDQIKRWH